MKQVNDACRLVLEAKYKLGLFENPYRGISEKRAAKEIMSSDKLALAKESAIKSMVLLKNENNAILVITHYQRLLDYIIPDFVHVLMDGKIVKSGGKELAYELEEKGYDWIKELI